MTRSRSRIMWGELVRAVERSERIFSVSPKMVQMF